MCLESRLAIHWRPRTAGVIEALVAIAAAAWFAPATLAQSNPDVIWRINAHGVLGVASLSFSPDGAYLASAARNNDAGKVWRTADATLHLTIDSSPFPRSEEVFSVSFSSDGTNLAAAGGGEFGGGGDEFSRLRVIRVTDGSRVWDEYSRGDFGFDDVQFSPDGSEIGYFIPANDVLAVTSADGPFGGGWFGNELGDFRSRPPFAWSSDGRFIAAGGFWEPGDCDETTEPCENNVRLCWLTCHFGLATSLRPVAK